MILIDLGWYSKAVEALMCCATTAKDANALALGCHIQPELAARAIENILASHLGDTIVIGDC